MAISASNLATTGSNADATSYTTASISPGTNKLLLAWVYSISASAPNTPTASGNDLTWVQVDSQIDSSNLRRITLFRAMGNPSSGTVTFDFSGQTQTGCAWSIVQYSGVDITGENGSGAIVQSAKNASAGTATSLTVTLGTFSYSKNATVGGFGIPLNTAATPVVGSGFTATGQRNQATPNLSIGSEFLAGNDTSVDMTSGASSIQWVGIAAELKIAKSEMFSDNFNDNSLSSSWSSYNTVAETSGQLLITLTGASPSYNGIYTPDKHDLTGSYCYVEVVDLGDQTAWTSLEVEMQLLANGDSNNRIFFNINNNTIYAYKTVAGATTSLASTAWSTSKRWLRIREDSGTTYWEYGGDGKTWTTLHSAANPVTVTDIEINIDAGIWAVQSGTETVTFDNFNVSHNGNFFAFMK